MPDLAGPQIDIEKKSVALGTSKSFQVVCLIILKKPYFTQFIEVA